MVKIGFIGCGRWGQNLIRAFSQVDNVRMAGVCDLDEKKAEMISKFYPHVTVFRDVDEMLRSPLDAVVIATPAKTHYGLAKKALESGKHALVEKPMSLSVNDCEDLVNISRKNNRVLMVGHTFLYNNAVKALKEYVDEGKIGRIFYIFSQRLNLGTVRRDVNAMWNFAPHDISIICHVLGQKPVSISARGLCYLKKNVADVVFLHMVFPDGTSAHVHNSWLDPMKLRKMVVVGSKKMIIYDDVSPDAKLRIYDKGIDKLEGDQNLETFADFQLRLRAGDILIPKIDFVEPLKKEAAHYIDCIRDGTPPLTDGLNGLQVVKILEHAEDSMRRDGVTVTINWDD